MIRRKQDRYVDHFSENINEELLYKGILLKGGGTSIIRREFHEFDGSGTSFQTSRDIGTILLLSLDQLVKSDIDNDPNYEISGTNTINILDQTAAQLNGRVAYIVYIESDLTATELVLTLAEKQALQNAENALGSSNPVVDLTSLNARMNTSLLIEVGSDYTGTSIKIPIIVGTEAQWDAATIVYPTATMTNAGVIASKLIGFVSDTGEVVYGFDGVAQAKDLPRMSAGEIVSAAEIRDRLSTLTDDDRLDASAIKNLPEPGSIESWDAVLDYNFDPNVYDYPARRPNVVREIYCGPVEPTDTSKYIWLSVDPIPAPALDYTLALKNVTLEWTSSATDIDGFEVFRRISGQTTWNLVQTVLPDQLSWTDTNTNWETTYEYVTRGKNGDWLRSPLSNISTVVIGTEQTDALVNIITSLPNLHFFFPLTQNNQALQFDLSDNARTLVLENSPQVNLSSLNSFDTSAKSIYFHGATRQRGRIDFSPKIDLNSDWEIGVAIIAKYGTSDVLFSFGDTTASVTTDFLIDGSSNTGGAGYARALARINGIFVIQTYDLTAPTEQSFNANTPYIRFFFLQHDKTNDFLRFYHEDRLIAEYSGQTFKQQALFDVFTLSGRKTHNTDSEFMEELDAQYLFMVKGSILTPIQREDIVNRFIPLGFPLGVSFVDMNADGTPDQFVKSANAVFTRLTDNANGFDAPYMRIQASSNGEMYIQTLPYLIADRFIGQSITCEFKYRSNKNVNAFELYGGSFFEGGSYVTVPSNIGNASAQVIARTIATVGYRRIRFSIPSAVVGDWIEISDFKLYTT